MPDAARALRSLLVASIAGLAGCSPGLKTGVAIGQIEQPGNTQVPLPPGTWTQLTAEALTAGNVISGGINNDHSVLAYYARIENGRIAQLVYVRTSAGAPAPYGYGTGGDCLRTTPNDYSYLKDSRGGTPNAIDCMEVVGARRFNPPRQSSSAVYRKAYEAAKAYGGLPNFAVMAEFAEAHSQRFETYYMFFFPDQSPAATTLAGWQAGSLTPANRAYVDGIVTWARDFRDAVRLGTEHRL